MKKIVGIIFCIFVVLSFTACSLLETESSELTVEVEGVTYRGGFYDDNLLYPIDITLQEDFYTVDHKKIQHVDFERFDIVQSIGKGDINGVLYCVEEQWGQAKAYYADGDNFEYYYTIGVKNVKKNSEPVVITIPDIDAEKFDALMNFADKNRYKPFGATNKKTRRLPMPNSEETLSFYKKSKDGFLASVKGFDYYVDNDKLVFVYYYDHGYGKYEEIVVVDVPDELSQYFMELIATYH
ncbi:hypothetical protein [Anaerosporobacter sp.]|uniref:hypothetical protein n=1 Tax=Anaerosporobacter sp. TaxID=1872529 RepID=UPI00286ED03B|nr:hypothetical protein [Anaerosporobacter sp.]